MEKMKIRVLSLKQPFAELVVSGKKKIEIRTLNTKYRGALYIHASKNADKKACERFGLNPKELQTGAIIGKVELVDTKEYRNEEEFRKDEKHHLVSPETEKDFDWAHKKKYGFILRNPKIIKPVQLKGKLRIFEVKT